MFVRLSEVSSLLLSLVAALALSAVCVGSAVSAATAAPTTLVAA